MENVVLSFVKIIIFSVLEYNICSFNCCCFVPETFILYVLPLIAAVGCGGDNDFSYISKKYLTWCKNGI